MNRLAVAGVWVLGCIWCTVAAAASQESAYPNKPIRFVVGFAPGGGTDIVARLLSKKMTESLGQSVVVDNRSGAGGTIANDIVRHAAPDGYTINVTTSSYAVSSSVYQISYDPVNGISPIGMVGTSPFLLTVYPSLPINSVKELIGYANAQRGKMNYGSTGQGGITHIGVELFKLMANVDMNHIPYRGTGPALIALIGGEIHFMLGTNITTVPHIRAKRLRALAVTTLKRSPAVPDLPTVDEAGVPGYDLMIWYGIWGPARMPKPVVTKLNTELKRILALQDIWDSFSREGLEVAHSSAEEFKEIIRRDIEKFSKVAKAAKITVQ